LANSERYITPELKEVEDKVLGAEDKSIRLEYRLFVEIREQIGKQINRIQAAAAILASIGCTAFLCPCFLREQLYQANNKR
jgi:DNA mismatch repair protein MutS